MRLLARSRAIATLVPFFAMGLFGITAQAMVPPSERAVLDAIYYGTGGIPPQGGSRSWINITGWGLPPFLGISECDSYGVTCVIDQGQEHIAAILLDENGLTGRLPSSLADLPYLQTFSAHGNDIGGPIPSTSGLTKLIYFDLEDNQLTGVIPSLAGLTHLEYFAVDQNQLTGSIPPLTGLTSLQDFRVYRNRLTGPIPSLATLAALTTFAAFENDLSGPLPDLANTTALFYFNVGANHLTGEIPSLAALSSLGWFDISSNELTGLIPAAPANLQFAAVCSNRLTLNSQPSIDPAWNSATGYSPWWAAPFGTNRCDELLYGDFEWPPSQQ